MAEKCGPQNTFSDGYTISHINYPCRPHTGKSLAMKRIRVESRTYNTKYTIRDRRLSFPNIAILSMPEITVYNNWALQLNTWFPSSYQSAVIHLIAMPRRCCCRRVGALLMKMKDCCKRGPVVEVELNAWPPIAAAVWRRINRLYSRVFSLCNEIKSWLLSDSPQNVGGGRAPLICEGTEHSFNSDNHWFGRLIFSI